MRIVVGVLVLAGLFAGGMYLKHLNDISKVFDQSAGNMKEAAALVLASVNQQGLSKCNDFPVVAKNEQLARALVTVERFATSDLERGLEALIARGLVAVGLPIPDLSLGDGQIKFSTAKKLVVEADGRSHQLYAGVGDERIVRDLLDACRNQVVAALLVASLADPQSRKRGDYGRKELLRVAAAYNGQKERPSLRARVSATVYNELVYEIYQLYRFEALVSERAGLRRGEDK